ncbi:MAG: FAD-dependent oxidoreductase [Syntrophobacteraceae bacterium]|nr:FAD-dependent oxidoreductase [Syntrophobacteraceae bacterium]
MPKLVIIGGSDAGISAALRAKELSPATEVSVVVADRYPNFSICGLPFFLSGEVPDWRSLAHRTTLDIEKEGVRLLLDTLATSIDPVSKTVLVSGRGTQPQKLHYDGLVIATGARSIRPNLEGIELPGVFVLRWMEEAFAMRQFISETHPRSALIVGAGYIGMEMADALTLRGIEVTVVEFLHSVLTTVDKELGERIEANLKTCGVKVNTGITVTGIKEAGGQLLVNGSGGFSCRTDMVLVAVGARPRTELALSAGIETGLQGAMKVDRAMRTNAPDIFAAGDCVETWHRLFRQNSYLPLGTTAHKQGRVAGENAVGGNREFQGTLGTQAVKIFDQVVARTGLRDSEALPAGLEPITVEFEAWDHKAYYPGAQKLWIRLTGSRSSGRLLGAQILGHRDSEVSKRIDIIASALYNEMRVEDLSDLDLSYTPPLSSPWDPVQMAAQAWNRTVQESKSRIQG